MLRKLLEMSIDYSVFAFPKSPKKEKSKPKKMKNKSNKLANLERKRFSILTEDLEHCYLCAKDRKNIKKKDLHEIFGGRNRKKSMIWGLVIPICRKHHTEITNNKELSEELKSEGRKEFEKLYGKDKFIEEFK